MSQAAATELARATTAQGRAVAIARSAFQVLNVLEALDALGIASEDCQLVLWPIFDGSTEPEAQMRKLASTVVWAGVTSAGRPSGRSDLGHIVRTALIARRIGRAATLFVPGPNPLFAPFYWASRPDRLVVVDEGIGIVGAPQPPTSASTGLGRGLRRRLRDRTGFDPGYVEAARDRGCSITVFSAVRDSVDPGDVLVPNTFARTRASIARADRRDESWIIGQPLVEIGLVDTERHVGLVQRLAESATSTPVYIAHPRESPATLEALAAAGVTVERLDDAVEPTVAAGRVPLEVLGFYSTAIVMLALLVPGIPVRLIELRVNAPDRAATATSVAAVYQHIRALPDPSVTVLETVDL